MDTLLIYSNGAGSTGATGLAQKMGFGWIDAASLT